MPTSPQVTSGAGFDFEAAVGATYLASLFYEGDTRGLFRCTTRKVSFQQGNLGEPLDDIIVDASDASDQPVRLRLQIKRSLSFGEKAVDFRDVIQASWETIALSHFRENVDRVGIAVERIGEWATHIEAACETARHTSAAAEFLGQIEVRGHVADRQRQFTHLVRSALNEHFGRPPADEEIWRLMRHFVLLRFDFMHEGAEHAHTSVELLRLSLGQQDSKKAPTLWDQLRMLARTAAASAGALDRRTLFERLGPEYDVRRVRSFDGSLPSIANASDIVNFDYLGHGYVPPPKAGCGANHDVVLRAVLHSTPLLSGVPPTFNLASLWAFDRRRFVGVVAGDAAMVHNALRLAEQLLDDAFRQSGSEFPIPVRWWIRVNPGVHPHGPAEIEHFFQSAMEPDSQHVRALRISLGEIQDDRGRRIVPSILICVDSSVSDVAAAEQVEHWCRAIGDRIFSGLPSAVIVILEGSDRLSEKRARVTVDHLQRKFGHDRSWEFIERATLTKPVPNSIIRARTSAKASAEDAFWNRSGHIPEPELSHRPGFGLVRLFWAFRHLDEIDAAESLRPLFECIETNHVARQAFAAAGVLGSDQATFDKRAAIALGADFDEEAGGLAELCNDIAWPLVEAIGSDAQLMLINTLASSEQERVRILAFHRAASNADDRMVDAWLFGVGFDVGQILPRLAVAEASLVEKVVLGVLRIGRSKEYEARALAIVRGLPPLKWPLASIVELFKELCGSGVAIPVRRLTPALIALALRAQLAIALDGDEPPPFEDDQRSVVYWWSLMSQGPTLRTLTGILRHPKHRSALLGSEAISRPNEAVDPEVGPYVRCLTRFDCP